MTAVIQRVTSASVAVDGSTVGECGHGLCILLGVAAGDSERDAEVLARKIASLRIFEDGDGKMNLSVRDIGGTVLAVSNFTLLASYRKGNRPDFMGAEKPQRANELYGYFCERMDKSEGIHTERGIFGAEMKLSINNDGPVTIVMESGVLLK